MKIYAVGSWYFSNGKTCAIMIEKEVEKVPSQIVRINVESTFYIDYFVNKNDAELYTEICNIGGVL